ncbi:hypothetical protein HaLaN_04794 [Haematococcus lacustris]|uniref:Uncharacterized protein n=1 Tax=Haematococcus lacustris TaxID=44745 RepID=A0A699YHG8_HAELA|nr:hypothetical protein HaLaN_04794 [Haematococcus lacustris]
MGRMGCSLVGCSQAMHTGLAADEVAIAAAVSIILHQAAITCVTVATSIYLLLLL